MDLRRFGGGRGAERAANLGLDASLPSGEVHAAGDLEAEGVVLGVKDGVEVCKRERIQCGRGATQQQSTIIREGIDHEGLRRAKEPFVGA